jgi:uncharacterized membrane protein YhaH (DUF805 family)
MFQFSGRLGPRPFANAAAWRVALYLIFLAGVPLGMLGMSHFSVCVAPESCGGVAFGLSFIWLFVLKPLFLVVFAFSLVGISMRRFRDAGLPAWSGLFIPLMAVADYQYCFWATLPWGFLSSGVMRQYPPTFFAIALVSLVLLGLAPTVNSSAQTSPRRPEILLLALIAALLAFLAVCNILSFGGYLLRPRQILFSVLPRHYLAYLAFAFVAVAAFCLARMRRWAP